MALTKKRAALLTIAMSVVYFAAFSILPGSIVGDRQDYLVFFLTKISFLAVTAAICTSFVLVFIFRRSFFSGQLYLFKKYRHYIRLLVKRDFISKYRKSVLGVLWSVLNPLFTMLIMSIVFSRLFERDEITNYPIYFLSGQIIFAFFSDSTMTSMTSIINNESVIKKVYVPKYVFPLSKMLSSLTNLCFSFIAFLIVFIITGERFQWTMLLFPLPVIYVFVFALGVAMFMSAAVVFFRDLAHLYGVLMTLWMFMTPIMYPASIIPGWLVPFYGLNPLYQYVSYFRSIMIWNTVPDLWMNMVCIAFSLSSLCLGAYVFMRNQNKYILYI